MLLALLLNLRFNKKLCQIFFVLIREFKQLAPSAYVCVRRGVHMCACVSVKHADANTLLHEHFFFKWVF